MFVASCPIYRSIGKAELPVNCGDCGVSCYAKTKGTETRIMTVTQASTKSARAVHWIQKDFGGRFGEEENLPAKFRPAGRFPPVRVFWLSMGTVSPCRCGARCRRPRKTCCSLSQTNRGRHLRPDGCRKTNGRRRANR